MWNSYSTSSGKGLITTEERSISTPIAYIEWSEWMMMMMMMMYDDDV
jgi:hypothetical protein